MPCGSPKKTWRRVSLQATQNSFAKRGYRDTQFSLWVPLCQHLFSLIEREPCTGRTYGKRGFRHEKDSLLRLGSEFRKFACPSVAAEILLRDTLPCRRPVWVTPGGQGFISCQPRSTVGLWPAQSAVKRGHRWWVCSRQEKERDSVGIRVREDVLR